MKKLLVFGLSLFVAGCNYHVDKQTSGVQGPMSFATVQQSVFAPRCSQCHGAGTSHRFECSTYSHVKTFLREIDERVFQVKNMPPGAPLNGQQMALLSDWMKAGAPEFGQDAPIPPTPLEPKFASIQEKIFIPMCVSCHSPGQTGAQVSLDSAKALLNSPRDLVLPGNAKESGLFIAINRKDKKKMPPPTSGVRALTVEEIKVIVVWINNGAKD